MRLKNLTSCHYPGNELSDLVLCRSYGGPGFSWVSYRGSVSRGIGKSKPSVGTLTRIMTGSSHPTYCRMLDAFPGWHYCILRWLWSVVPELKSWRALLPWRPQ